MPGAHVVGFVVGDSDSFEDCVECVGDGFAADVFAGDEAGEEVAVAWVVAAVDVFPDCGVDGAPDFFAAFAFDGEEPLLFPVDVFAGDGCDFGGAESLVGVEEEFGDGVAVDS